MRNHWEPLTPDDRPPRSRDASCLLRPNFNRGRSDGNQLWSASRPATVPMYGKATAMIFRLLRRLVFIWVGAFV